MSLGLVIVQYIFALGVGIKIIYSVVCQIYSFPRSLLSISNSEILEELSDYYRQFIPRMSRRMMTPLDQPPYADELEQLLEAKPFFIPESEEEWEDISAFKGD